MVGGRKGGYMAKFFTYLKSFKSLILNRKLRKLKIEMQPFRVQIKL